MELKVECQSLCMLVYCNRICKLNGQNININSPSKALITFKGRSVGGVGTRKRGIERAFSDK